MESGEPSGPLIALSDAARLCYHSITGSLTDNATVPPWPNELMKGALRLGGKFLVFCRELRDLFQRDPSRSAKPLIG